jgi:hypothetical protein
VALALQMMRRLASASIAPRLYEYARRFERAAASFESSEYVLSNLARLSPKVAAILDWLQSANYASWGGPMNGQIGRQCLIREMMKVVDITAVIETGTYRGTTTEFLWHVTGKPVYSAESERRFFEYARRRFGQSDCVHLSHADSRLFLRRLANDDSVPKSNVLFYLDAHWGEDLPLREELRLITEHWTDPIIVIDDFEVPGDSGYGFDDYGEGQSLTVGYLQLSGVGDLAVLFPSLPSDLETGARRGCAVLVHQERAPNLLSHLPLRDVGTS